MTLPAPQSKILGQDDLTKHRAYIAIKSQALMGRYFQLPQDELVKREILLGWMDMLQDFTKDEIDYACRQYLIDFPRNRPHEGLIRQIIQSKRAFLISMQPKKQIERPMRSNPNAEERKKLANELLSQFSKKHDI